MVQRISWRSLRSLICSAWVSITSQDASMMSDLVEACVMFIGFDLILNQSVLFAQSSSSSLIQQPFSCPISSQVKWGAYSGASVSLIVSNHPPRQCSSARTALIVRYFIGFDLIAGVASRRNRIHHRRCAWQYCCISLRLSAPARLVAAATAPCNHTCSRSPPRW